MSDAIKKAVGVVSWLGGRPEEEADARMQPRFFMPAGWAACLINASVRPKSLYLSKGDPKDAVIKSLFGCWLSVFCSI